ncbi:MAG: alpha/beta hydrolase [Candidatus Peribacteria bacterium]|nr:MAG: alpha/beta hydrolase [Candidatus Peribacteria bacterium]
MVPRMLMVTVDEKFHHVQELEDMLPLWSQIRTPSVVMQGLADWIVPVENSYFIIEHLSSAHVTALIDDQQNHSLPFTNPARILNALDQLVVSNKLH